MQCSLLGDLFPVLPGEVEYEVPAHAVSGHAGEHAANILFADAAARRDRQMQKPENDILHLNVKLSKHETFVLTW